MQGYVFLEHGVYSSGEPGELSHWLCHDDINFVVPIAIPITTTIYYMFFLSCLTYSLE